MDGLFYWLINMSIAGTAAGLIVLLIRSVKRLPRRAAALMWLFPMIRAVIPVSVAGKYNLNSLLALFRGKTVYFTGPFITAANHVSFAESYFPLTFPGEIRAINVNGNYITVGRSVWSRVFSVGFIVWAVVAAALILTMAVIYFMTVRELKDAVLLRDNVYLSDKITSPAVYGIFRPRIILPAEYKDKEINYIIMHETAHIRHGDNFWRMLGFLVAAIHWFDPLAWIFLKVGLSDLELACDERVLKKLDADGRKQYALALVDAARPKNVFVSAFGGAKLRTRVENVLSYRKMSAAACVGLAALVAAVAYVLLTNAA